VGKDPLEIDALYTFMGEGTRDYMALETITGEGGWMDEVLVLDGPYIKDGFIQVTAKPGLGLRLNPDVVRAHLATGETWWD
jgi:L-alanine-DL-glutamate epimerase-like enolase superfamily enzyme